MFPDKLLPGDIFTGPASGKHTGAPAFLFLFRLAGFLLRFWLDLFLPGKIRQRYRCGCPDQYCYNQYPFHTQKV